MWVQTLESNRVDAALFYHTGLFWIHFAGKLILAE